MSEPRLISRRLRPIGPGDRVVEERWDRPVPGSQIAASFVSSEPEHVRLMVMSEADYQEYISPDHNGESNKSGCPTFETPYIPYPKEIEDPERPATLRLRVIDGGR